MDCSHSNDCSGYGMRCTDGDSCHCSSKQSVAVSSTSYSSLILLRLPPPPGPARLRSLASELGWD